MKVRLLSDLHHEFRPDTFEYQTFIKHCGEDLTVLAGDIAVGAQSVAKVLDLFIRARHKHIVYVPGNHEYYGGQYTEVHQELVDVCKARREWVTMLQPGVKLIRDDLVVVGGTLWTNFGEDQLAQDTAQHFISDFRVIKGFKTQMAKHLYYSDLAWIKRVCEQHSNKQKLIITHFLPAKECVDVKYKHSQLNSYFANDLGSWIETLEDAVWLYGHTHECADFHIGTTRMVCNPLGYPQEYNRFDNYKTVVL